MQEAQRMELKKPDLKYIRQQDIIPSDLLNKRITLVGAGAVGGTTAFFLAKTGFKNLRIYDFDTVELHNLPNSIYRMSDLGKPKVTAIKEIIKEFDGVDIQAINKKWDRMSLEGVHICSVDSMKTRHQMWRTIKRRRSSIPLYIDGRMGAEVMRIYAIDPLKENQAKLYESTLCADNEVEVAPCTAKSTMYCASIIAGIIVSLVKRCLLEQKLGIQKDRKEPAREIIYDIPSDMFLSNNPLEEPEEES